MVKLEFNKKVWTIEARVTQDPQMNVPIAGDIKTRECPCGDLLGQVLSFLSPIPEPGWARLFIRHGT